MRDEPPANGGPLVELQAKSVSGDIRIHPRVTRRALLRDRALLALLARDVISTAGSQMTWVALPWFVVTTTGSATKMAIVVAVEAAALGIVGFAAGNLVGRVGLRRTMLVADACRAPLIAAVPLLYAAGLLSFPLLLVLVFAVGAFGTPSFVSKAAILPEIVGEDEGVLGEANALLQAAMRIALVLGPVLAGVLIGVIGATNVLYIDAATFLVAFVLIASSSRSAGRLRRPRSRAASAPVCGSCSRTGSSARGRLRSWPATSRGWRSSWPCRTSSSHGSGSSPRYSVGSSAHGALVPSWAAL